MGVLIILIIYKDPTIQGTILGSPNLGNSHVYNEPTMRALWEHDLGRRKHAGFGKGQDYESHPMHTGTGEHDFERRTCGNVKRRGVGKRSRTSSKPKYAHGTAIAILQMPTTVRVGGHARRERRGLICEHRGLAFWSRPMQPAEDQTAGAAEPPGARLALTASLNPQQPLKGGLESKVWGV